MVPKPKKSPKIGELCLKLVKFVVFTQKIQRKSHSVVLRNFTWKWPVGSDNNADRVSEEDRFKFCDDLSILELGMLANALIEYNFLEHVASNVGMDQHYLSAQGMETKLNLDNTALWTEDNLMQLKESKTNYIIFTRSRQEFATRLTVNNKLIERQEYVQLLGVWLQPDGGWGKQVKELCKKAYRRMIFLTKLRYAGVCRKDLIHNYKQFIGLPLNIAQLQSTVL